MERMPDRELLHNSKVEERPLRHLFCHGNKSLPKRQTINAQHWRQRLARQFSKDMYCNTRLLSESKTRDNMSTHKLRAMYQTEQQTRRYYTKVRYKQEEDTLSVLHHHLAFVQQHISS